MIRTELTRRGFTIVELLIVVVVIAILASFALVSFNGITSQADEASLRSDLKNAITKLSIHKVQNDIYPDNLELAGINDGNNSEFTYSKFSDNSFCLSARSKIDQTKVFFVDENGEVNPGSCEPARTDIAASNDYTCGILSGKLYCWGNGLRIGTGATSGTFSTPQPVDTTHMKGKVTSISLSSGYACAVADNKAYCWGNAGAGPGNLGNGSTEGNFYIPQPVDSSIMSGSVTGISTHNSHSCAIADKKAYCWGRGTSGQLGNNTNINSSTPVAVNTSLMSGDIDKISVGNNGTCALSGGLAYCWGSNTMRELGIGGSSSSVCGGNYCTTPKSVVVTGVDIPFTDISISAWHTCAIAGGKAYCWGMNNDHYGNTYGHLGNGNEIASTYSPIPVNTENMPGLVTSIHASSNYTCALSNAKVYCWGNGLNGALGINTHTVSRYIPVDMSTLLSNFPDDVSSISSRSGSSHNCLISNGDAYCWGYGSNGKLGNGLTTNSLSSLVKVIKPTL